MANLPESPTYEAGVYQFETSDPLQGGPNGIDNLPHKALANRTAYLKAQTDALTASNSAHIGAGGTAHATATTTAAGFMSAADKVTLNNMASAPTLGAHIGTGGTAHATATTTAAGFMSATDKVAMANLATHIGAGGTAHAAATTTAAGFMSAADKVALAATASAANLAALAEKFSGLLATNGYLRIPLKIAGADQTLIVQWGQTQSQVPSSTRTVVFPVAFPNACLNVQATHLGWGGSIAAVSELTKNNFLLSMCQEFGGCPTQTQSYGAYWLAIGY